jgi:hypothetical protein
MKIHLSSTIGPVFSTKGRAGIKTALYAAAILLLLYSSLLLAQDEDGGAFLPAQVNVAPTVPANGDLNPYGVAFVPQGFPSGGTAAPGNILVSNFNNSSNLQGTGTTIVDLPPGGGLNVFFQGAPGLGLTTALNILRAGFVLVGNFPSADGTCATAKAGSILVIGKGGNLVSTISNSMIKGPWDSTLLDEGSSAKFFVANALTGAVVRLDLAVGAGGVTVKSTTQIASGYKFQCDPVTFVDAPTGLVYDVKRDVLYVASSADNKVFAVGGAGSTNKDRGTGSVIYSDNAHLHGPLGMIQAPNGDLIVSNNDSINSDSNQPSELVEFTKDGQFVKQISVDPMQGGSFGLAVATSGTKVRFAAVDDVQNILLIWTLPLPQ